MENNLLLDIAIQYIIVRINDELLAVEIKDIESIVVRQKITRIPDSQSYFKGVINLRGEIIPMISLRERINSKEDEYTNKSRFIVLKTSEHSKIGFIVDEVREVIELKEEDIDKVNTSNETSQSFGVGIAKYKKELITVLNIAKVIED
ncbi:MAG TPA: purine-binding chemotaxis protein CheW [Clostridiales bacterium]|nr:purine-binding chemotaxis protein CheW [Clostridiales bacterium]